MKTVDPGDLAPQDVYRLMISAIVPRPIALVSTLGPDGVRNVAPFSFFSGVSSRPPLLSIAIGAGRSGEKDTLRNIRATREFVVNVVSEPLAAAMVASSGDYPPDVDEFEVAGLTPVPSDKVRCPRVGESPVQAECVLAQLVEQPGGSDATLVIGRVLRFHVARAVLDRASGTVDPRLLRPVGRLGGDLYATLEEPFALPRPRVTR